MGNTTSLAVDVQEHFVSFYIKDSDKKFKIYAHPDNVVLSEDDCPWKYRVGVDYNSDVSEDVLRDEIDRLYKKLKANWSNEKFTAASIFDDLRTKARIHETLKSKIKRWAESAWKAIKRAVAGLLTGGSSGGRIKNE